MKKQSIAGLGIAVLIIFLVALLFYSRDGILQRAEWVAFYVSIALVTGIIFWIVTPGGHAELTIPKLGIKLVGGAAVGAIFMILAHRFTPEPEIRAYELPSEIRQADFVFILDHSPKLDVYIREKKWLLVEFGEGDNNGEVKIEYYTDMIPVQKCYEVKRAGNLRKC